MNMSIMREIRILFVLDHKLMAYRLPFFEQLAKKGYNVSVYHPGPALENISYITQKISHSRNIFPGLIYRANSIAKNTDIVVYMQNIRIINLWFTTLNPFKGYKLIHWGIGTSSAKGLILKPTIISRIRSFLSGFSSAQILYSDYPLPLFSKSIQKKTFIANNTVYNPKMENLSSEIKNSFLFIGTLNKRKGLDDLIFSFSNIIFFYPDANLQLNIIGDGPEKKNLIKLVDKLKIKNYVTFTGKISSSNEKYIYFKRAIACVSPRQAGLSVLESFSYGVPFIAYRNAISGGEHLNIENGFNGYLLNSNKELTESLIKLFESPKLAKKLGSNAFEYYKSKRQMKHMVDVFDSAFKYVINS